MLIISIVVGYLVIGYIMAHLLFDAMEADAQVRIAAIEDAEERQRMESVQEDAKPIAKFIIMVLWPIALISQGIKKL